MAFNLKLGTLGVQITLDDSQFRAGVASAMGSLKSMGAAAAGLGAVLGGALAAGIGASVSSFARLEQELMNAAAVTKEGAANFGAFQQAAMAASAGSVFSASEAAQALKYMSMAGMTAQQSMASLSTVLKIATATNTDLAFASDLVTDVMTAMRYKVSDLAMVGDVLVKTTISSNTNMSMLGETLKYVAGTAGAAGQDLKEIAASAGLMANAGVKASQAGTSLRMAMLRLQAPTNKGAAALKALKIEALDSQGKLRPLTAILIDLANAQKTVADADFTRALNEIFGAEAMTGIQAALSAGADGIRKFRSELDQAGGTAERVSKLMEGTLSNQLRILSGNAENIASTFGQFFAPAVRVVNDALKAMLLSVLNTDKGYNTMRDAAANLVESFADLLIGLGNLVQFGYKAAGVFGELANELDGVALAANVAWLQTRQIAEFMSSGSISYETTSALDNARLALKNAGRQSGKIYEHMAAQGKKAAEGIKGVADNMHNAAAGIRSMTRETFKLTTQLDGMARKAADSAGKKAKLALGGKKAKPVGAVGEMAASMYSAEDEAKKLVDKLEAETKRLEGNVGQLMGVVLTKAGNYAAKQTAEMAKKAAEAQRQQMEQLMDSAFSAGVSNLRTVTSAIFGDSGLGKLLGGFIDVLEGSFDEIKKIMGKAMGGGELNFGDFKNLIAGGLAQLSKTLVTVIMENEQMQKNLSVVKQIAKNIGLKSPLTAIFELYRAPLGAISSVVNSLKPVFDMLGGSPMKNMARNFFGATKFFLSTTLGVAEAIINVSQRVMTAMSWLINKVAGALNKIGIHVLDSTADRLAASASKLGDALDTVRAAQDELAGLTYDEAMAEYNKQLNEATDNMAALNDELVNAPAGFKRVLDLIRYSTQDTRTNARSAGGVVSASATMRTRVQEVGGGGTVVNGDIVMAIPTRAAANEYKRQLAAQEFAYRGRTGSIPSRSQQSKKRAYK